MAILGRGRDSACVAIVGSGGAGSLTAGSLLLEAAGRAGWYGLMTRSVGPQIRGGEAAAFIRIATSSVDCMDDRFDALIAIDWLKVDRFTDEVVLDADSLLVGDPRGGEIPHAMKASGASVIEVEFKDRAKAIEGGRPNMIALGVAAGLLGLPASVLNEVVARRLGSRGEAALASNRASVEFGIAEAKRSGRGIDLARGDEAPGAADGRWILTGNQSAGLGAIRGGIRFTAAYPITPATEILEWLTPALSEVGGVLMQAEDELASVNMIIGASFGGTPSLTATSGPGLALMSEAIGLATAAEIPIVVVDVMRGGPSTGIPTKSEQSDLDIAVYGCHGDAPHVVVAPVSTADCLFTTQWAVHLAEALQTPAIVLSDQFLGQTQVIVPRPEMAPFRAARRTAGNGAAVPYRRYAYAEDGVSPMSIPGHLGGQYTADGLTHNERGTPSSKAGDHLKQLDKRQKKIGDFDYGPHWAEIDGDGEDVILTWGSLTGPAREAARRLRSAGVSTRVVSLRLIAPLQVAALQSILGDRRVLVVEQNHGGQLHKYLRSRCDLPGRVRTLNRPGPQPIRPGEIRAAVEAGEDKLSTQAKAKLKARDFTSDLKPVWCPGCGDYHVLLSLTRALAEIGIPPEQTAVVSGIGCSSRIPAYTNCYGFHGVHGRSLALGTGLKVTRPDLTVLVMSGDGDGFSIGGNHFLHACRRNVDLTYIVMDNQVYGMTKGQPSPTTAPDWAESALAPSGTGLRPFHPLVIALASGANFVARAFSGHPDETAEDIVEAVRHPGFSFVEVLSPCVTFRPDQAEWKNMVHPAPVAPTDDPARAARRIMTDDGFNIGVLYRGTRAPYAPRPNPIPSDIAMLEKEFAL